MSFVVGVDATDGSMLGLHLVIARDDKQHDNITFSCLGPDLDQLLMKTIFG